MVTFDGRGNGRSDRPGGATAYSTDEFAADALAVLDATGADRTTLRTTLVALSCGALWATILAADHPERVDGVVYIAPAVPLAPNHPERDVYAFDEPLDTDQGWAKYNSYYWSAHYRDFLEFFFAQCANEPHSTKQIEDAIGWGLQTDPATIIRGIGAEWPNDCEHALRLCGQVQCPPLVIQGSEDAVVGPARGAAVAEAIPRARLITLEGCGHSPHLRDPVITNLLIRDFASQPGPR